MLKMARDYSPCFNGGDERTNGELLFFDSEIKGKKYIIFDVGSRYDSLFVNQNNFEVHYFEPDGSSLTKLTTIEKNPNVRFNHFGLGNEPGAFEYWPITQSFFDRSLTRAELPKNSKTVEFIIKRGADYILENDVTLIDFLKIDTEGFEPAVIEGFGEHIEKVRIIQFEYGGCWLDSKGKLSNTVSYLTKHGFTNFSYLSRNGKMPVIDTKDHYLMCNIVCYNSRYL